MTSSPPPPPDGGLGTLASLSCQFFYGPFNSPFYVIKKMSWVFLQNCGILLTKLKMTDEEITSAILSVDENDELSKDMIEQVMIAQ